MREGHYPTLRFAPCGVKINSPIPGKFDFKLFSVSHSRSSMKVGVDGVLIGLWADVPSSGRILDVGCGCGVISLICAQRSSDASVLGLDFDAPSIEEAEENFKASPWSSRLSCCLEDFSTFAIGCRQKFELIISNPPYFDSGIEASVSRRLSARHQGALSPAMLVETAQCLLTSCGRLALILPSEFASDLIELAANKGLYLSRETIVRGHAAAPPKRALLEFTLQPVSEPQHSELILEQSPGIPTPEYRHLGRKFYLKF